MDIDISALRMALSYDPATGYVTWKQKVADKCVVGSRLGSVNKHGYLQCQVRGQSFRVHRLIWMLFYGEIPPLIDHKNGNRTDNRISNLRLATPQQNSRNSKRPSTNTSGFKGVSWCASRRKWLSQIAVGGGKTKNLGRFSKQSDAVAAYQQAAITIHGEFANFN